MKRTALKRTAPPRRVASGGRFDPERELFKLAARQQRKFCQCRTPMRGQAHHVLYEQHAKAEGVNAHDERNAMLVCGHCHYQHHQATERIPERDIPAPAIEFLVETLGVDRARDYLTRYYG